MVKKKKPKFEWRVKKKPPPPWIDLPRDITANILSRLGAIDIIERAQKVCMTWRSVCKDPHMWRVIDMKYSGDPYPTAWSLDHMCRHAVDRSQGQLTDISIQSFGSDDLLLHISERSSQLKCLRLACCHKISGLRLSQAVEKFPQLSELHLFIIPLTFDRHIQAIGRACPLLKSFSLNNSCYRTTLRNTNNDHALAVAQNMPGLHHLSLFGNLMTNEGLEAILIGCPQLESLDIRQCFNVDLQDQTGDLGRRCALQIREFRGPKDSDTDYEFSARIYNNDDDMYSDDYSDEYSFTWSIGDYDDYTNPFSGEYFSDNDIWGFDTLTLSEYNDYDYL